MCDDVFRMIREYNSLYEANDCNGQMLSDKNYKTIIGTVPIILSAPHSVKQRRHSAVKLQDILTGAITEYLCEKTGAFGIIRTCNLDDDPNYYNDPISRGYKDEIVRMVREHNITYLFDIHGCSDKYGFDIDIGTNGYGNVSCSAREIEHIKSLMSVRLSVETDCVFRAARSDTVSCYVHRACGINCLQMELSRQVRTTPEKLNAFISDFTSAAEYISDMF